MECSLATGWNTIFSLATLPQMTKHHPVTPVGWIQYEVSLIRDIDRKGTLLWVIRPHADDKYVTPCVTAPATSDLTYDIRLGFYQMVNHKPVYT